MVQREDMIYHIHISYVWLLFLQLGSQEFSSKEVLPFVQRHSEPRRRFARCVRAHGTARSMRDKAEETMSRERSHAAFVVLSCSAVLLTLLGVVGISRSVLASSVGPAAARGSAALGDAPARLGVARTAHARRCADVRIVGAGIVPRAASEDGEWWLGYPLGEQVDDVPTHYSHIMRNFVPSVLRCTAVNGPGACYNVHLPLARLKSAGKDALVEAVTAEVASLVNNATVTFVDSGEDRVSGHAGGKVSRASSTSSARARGALGVGVRRAGPGRTRPPPTASGDSPPGDSPPGDSPPGDSPPSSAIFRTSQESSKCADVEHGESSDASPNTNAGTPPPPSRFSSRFSDDTPRGCDDDGDDDAPDDDAGSPPSPLLATMFAAALAAAAASAAALEISSMDDVDEPEPAPARFLPSSERREEATK